jgi:hypothetical protein
MLIISPHLYHSGLMLLHILFTVSQINRGIWCPDSQVFRRIASLSTRVLAYLRAREECWREISGRFDASSCSPHTEPSAREGIGSERMEMNGDLSIHGAVLIDMIFWLTTYRDLFTRPCNNTRKLLSNDPTTQYLMPPLFRPFV